MTDGKNRRRRFVGTALIILIAFLAGAIGGGVSRAIGSQIFCLTTFGNGDVSSGGNCNDVFCNTLTAIYVNNAFDNCAGINCPNGSSQVNFGDPACTTTQGAAAPCTLQLTKTNISAFTSATYTNIVTSVSPTPWSCPFGVTRTLTGGKVSCTAAFSYDTGVGTTIAKFRFSDSTNHLSAAPLQIGPGLVLNSNETIAMQSILTPSSPSSGVLFRFQISVTGIGATINIGPGEVDCLWTDTQASAIVS